MTREFKIFLAAALVAALAAIGAGCKAGDEAGARRAGASTTTTATTSTPSGSDAAGATPHPTSTPNDGVRRVTVEETQRLVAAGEAVVVDVRARAQYEQSRIKGSISVPRTEIDQRLPDLPKDKLLIFYCAWPTEHQSAGAALDIKKRGYENTAALLGGWAAWTGKGLPTESTK